MEFLRFPSTVSEQSRLIHPYGFARLLTPSGFFRPSVISATPAISAQMERLASADQTCTLVVPVDTAVVALPYKP